jgi:hypothetical protein
MRTTALQAMALLALAVPAAAQEREIEAATVPRDLADRLIGIANDPATQRFLSGLDLPSGSALSGDVVVMGPARIGGRVDGELIVVNGDLELAPTAEVTGDLTVVRGAIRGGETAALGGTVMAFGGSPVLLGPVGETVSTGDRGFPNGVRRDLGEDGFSRLTMEFGSFNRVEGLPVRVGPSVSSGGSNPFRAEGGVVLRTEGAVPFQNDRYGYWVQAEQFVGGGRRYRVGGGIFSHIGPIESWGVTDDENALSTFLFTRDQRDHLERWGWRVFARATPRRLPLDLTVEYRDEEMGSVAERDPWSIFGGDRGWRLQPLVAEGSLRSVETTLRIDTRDDGSCPARFAPCLGEPRSGWWIQASWLEGLGGTLAVPTTAALPPAFSPEFSRGLLDARRYNRVGGAYLNFRGVLGGSPEGEILPPQYQHSLGGVGSLPAYPAFAADCGARASVVTYAEGAGDRAMYPFYGCDRFGLFQAEFRGGLGTLLGFGGSQRLDPDPGWVFFFDAGRAWSNGDWGALARTELPVLYDAGIGVMLGDVGIYWAHPFGQAEGEGESTITLRMGRRF